MHDANVFVCGNAEWGPRVESWGASALRAQWVNGAADVRRDLVLRNRSWQGSVWPSHLNLSNARFYIGNLRCNAVCANTPRPSHDKNAHWTVAQQAALAAYTVLWAKDDHQIWFHLELAL